MKKEVIYRLGNKEDVPLYKQGIIPHTTQQHQLKSVYFSNSLDAVFEYREATKKGETHSKNNSMEILYSLLVEYDPKITHKMCVTRGKGGICKSFFFLGEKMPRIILIHHIKI